MKTHFPRYFGFLISLFILWLSLSIARGIGFNFGLDTSIFFRIFSLLFFIFMVLEIKERRLVIWPILVRIKSRSFSRAEEIQKKVIYFSPKKMIGRAGNSVVLFFVVLSLSFINFWRIFKKYVLSKSMVLFLSVFGVLFDVFVLDFTSALVVLLLVGLWIWTIQLYKPEGWVLVGGGLIFLALCPLLLIIGKEPIAEKSAVWVYMFLVVGAGQMLIKYLKEGREHARIKNK